MKKLALLLTAFLSLGTATTTQAIAVPEAYVETGMPLSAQPEVIEFFSFTCPLCYEMEYTYHVPAKIKAKLPQGVKFKQVMVNLGGTRMESDLMQAWALAEMLNVQDKVREPLFNTVRTAIINHKNGVPSREDLRKIFAEAGVTDKEFNAIDSFAVNALVQKNVKLISDLKVEGVPAFFVNQKYTVNPQKLPRNNVNEYMSNYVDTIISLLDKK